MEPLTAQLEAACLRVLHRSWRDLNHDRFRAELSPPALELADVTSRLGRWEPVTRTIQLSRALVLDGSWGQVIEVLKHEMAHQYVWEVLGERDETPHGPCFRATCDRLGIDDAAAGMPVAGEAAQDRVVERVSKLLALAGSPNEHEARAAMAAAQRLMLRHNVAMAGKQAGRYRVRHLGTPTARVPEAERILAGILSAHFFVECLWIPVWRAREHKRGLLLEICGSDENVELAAHVHAFLLATAGRLWRDFQRVRHAPDRDRRAFQAGVIGGFGDTLQQQAERHRAEALIWVGDAELRQYQRRRHPHRRQGRYTPSLGAAARAEGRDQGRRVVLHKPMASEGRARPRLLTGR